MAEAPLLRLAGVRKSYGTEVVTEVLHGVDLTLGPGEFTALVGPSGSGKSTLLHLLGLLDRPTAGSIELDGTDTGSLDDDGRTRFRGEKLGFVFQFHHLLPEFSALENVYLPLLSARGREDEEMRARARELLVAIGLSDRLDYRATNLSGGQQQRVAIARSLARRPPLVLADEPTGNLDTQTGDQVFALLRRFNREEGTAFLVVTHDPRIAERCDRVVSLVDGRIVDDRPGRGAA
ncbi:MAG: ABC transporter ATP-binding protein [Acidobacteria bacterium]|nr:MAG: ABC transporter ATP-binding protein [Acidobacteriota bacterium]MCE7960108.1 ABC transporter ATP-binding protein [Acidobacteria bacterium ACB2]